MNKPAISAVLCTYNPRRDLIARALRAIAAQSHSVSDFELIVVDNNSSPPLEESWLASLAGRNVRLVRETRQGLTFARVAGINAARADLICFFDDDNLLAPDYLENAVEIFRAEPALGGFGGIADGLLEARPNFLVAQFLPFMGVRDYGPEPLTGSGEKWGKHEPIGAGMCIRRDVAEGYVHFVENTDAAGGLGRRGTALLSGEDSLFSRIAFRLGAPVGYRPVLRLTHVITAPRLKMKYLARLMEGHGRSYVLLEEISGRPVEQVSPGRARKLLVKRFLHRLKSEGLAKALFMGFWDNGNFRQSRESFNSNENTIFKVVPLTPQGLQTIH